jgi:uncharacterized membrane protein YqjE
VSGHSASLLASLRGFASTATGVVRTRLELLSVEAQAEVGRVSGLLLWGVAAVLLAIAGSVFFAVFMTVALWESHRLLVLGIFAALFLTAALLAIARTLQLARQGSSLFSASLAELRRDAAALNAARDTDGAP